MDVSIIVVTYNSREHVADCLRSLERASPASGCEWLVVDNASTDGTLEEVRRCAPGARVLQTGDNLGYAKAVNCGLAASGGPFALVLNPDCVLAAGALSALLEHLRATPRCAIAGPRILDGAGRVEYSARSFPNHWTFLFNRYSLLTRLWPGNPWSRRYLLSDWDHASDREVDWVSGACLLVRREAVNAVGGMDEAFFMFNEDVDWCRRMRNAGWSVDFVAAAEVTHLIGASRRRVAPRVILERHRGMIHYFRKHHRAHPLLDALAAGLILLRARLLLAANALRR